MMTFFFYFLVIQTAYFLWMGFINAISTKAHNARKFSSGISKFSVYFHEFTHYLIAKLLFQPVQLSDIVIVGSNGLFRLKTRNSEGLTVIQAGLISLGPPFFSTIVIILLYRKILGYWGVNWGLTLIYIIIALSILQVATPSFADLKNIFSAFYHRPISGFRQIGIIFFGYQLYTHYYSEIISQFSLITEILFQEPIGLIIVIIALEGAVSLLYIMCRFLLSKLIRTGDFEKRYITNASFADYKDMAATRPLTRKKKVNLPLDQELCNDLV